MVPVGKHRERGAMCNVKRKQVRAENGEMGSLHAMLTRFPDEPSCEEQLMRMRFPEGWACPRCGYRSHTTVGGRRRMRQCCRCRLQFSVTSGTAMEGSKVSLRKWFHAMWLVSRSKRGVSALELAAQVGVSERTAGYMLLRIRGAMAGSERLQRP